MKILEKNYMKIETALILCAGFGKRLNPLTLETPKPLLKLNYLQSLSRDFSFLIDNELNVEDLVNEIKSVDKILIQKISVFDVYQGNNIPKDKKSVSLSILIQPADKSLTDDDLEKLSSQIIDSVFKKFGAEIRSL